MTRSTFKAYTESPPVREVQRNTPRGDALCERCHAPLHYEYASFVWQHLESDLCPACESKGVRILASSKDVDWVFHTGEYFQFFEARFEVNEAKRILISSPRAPIEYDLTCASYMVKLRAVATGSTEKVKLEIPIILATFRGVLLPIDGWHRIKHATALKLSTLPGFVLTRAETDSIRG